MIECLDEIVEIAEHEELRRHHHELANRELHHARYVQEVEHEYFPYRLGKVEDVCRPPYRHEDGEYAEHGQERHADEVVEPRHVDVLLVVLGNDAHQRTALHFRRLLLRMYLLR